MDPSGIGVMSQNGFDWTDYTVFFIMLGISVVIGIYFGWFKSEEKSPLNYLLAGKSMGPVPVGLSLLASLISGIMLIGNPAEVYTENLHLYLAIFGAFIGNYIAYKFYIPIFFELNLNTSYEYLELRFNKHIRRIAALFYLISYLIYLPIVMYIPSLMLNLVTGFNMYLIAIGTTTICVFYTMIGGLKAVIWTDFIQIIMAIIASIVIVIIGTINAGGLRNVLQLSYRDGKMNMFNMDPDPTIRLSFWTVFIGSMIGTIFLQGTTQGNIQRYMSLKSRDQLPKALLVYWALVFIVNTICAYDGLLIYAAYYGCDPIKNKVIAQPDQIFPYYVIDKVGYVPGLPGLFVAGIFGAALSTLSTGFNTMTQVIYDDYLKHKINPKHAHRAMMLITLFIGIFSTVSIYIVENLGKVASSLGIVTSMMTLPVAVLFTLGAFFPHTNTKGATVAMITSFFFILWISLGNMFSKVNLILPLVYPVENEDCIHPNDTITSTIIPETNTADDIFPLYKLSFMLYGFVGLLVGLPVGIITSYFTGPTDLTTLDPRLIAPPLRRFLPKKQEKEMILIKLMKENQ